MKALEFQKHAEKMFPVVPHMGLKVVNLSDTECLLAGSLAANKNHIGTAFGGSLYCFAALSCYGAVWALLGKNQMMTQDIVISEGNIKYLKSVNNDFEVRCQISSEATPFLSVLKSKNKARINLKAEVLCNKEICAEFNGSYVAFLKNF